MQFSFHRDFYNMVRDTILRNSVSFLLGPLKCGKSVCLRQIHDEIGNSEYVDLKKDACGDLYKQLEVFDRIFQAIKSNEDRLFLLDEITYVINVEFQIKEMARIFDDYSNNKTKNVITGSQSVALNAWANRAFGIDAGYIDAGFLTYTEFLRYKGLKEISAQTFNAFLYDSVAFHNITSLKEYLTRCIEETYISNDHTTEYIFDNDIFLIEDKIDLLVDLCSQALFPLVNKHIDKKNLEQALIFLNQCGLITNSPKTHTYINVTHPMIYGLILNEEKGYGYV